MKRLFALLSALLITAVVGVSLLPSGYAGETFNIEGKFKRIKPARLLEETDKVEVVDVFWYGCSHCYRFLPHLQGWEEHKPEYVEMRRLPAIFRDSWAAHARAYYTARLLGVDDQLHTSVFDAIHAKRRPLNTKQELMDFFAEHGVNETDFGNTYDSFTVDSLKRESEVMARRWGVQGTPSVIVNGRYLISGSTAGSYEDLIRVLEVLVEKEHKAMAQRKSS